MIRTQIGLRCDLRKPWYDSLVLALFDQNERFVLLERKYREAMTRKTRLEIFYEDMIKKLTRELQDLQNASGSVMRIDIEEIVKSVLSEVNDLHSKVTSIEDKIKTCVINFS